MTTGPAPAPPAQVHRGDRYRLNYTAGTVLALLADYGTQSTTDIFTVLDNQNRNAGIPGGEAGTQWTPPARRGTRTFKNNVGYRGKPNTTVNKDGTPRKYNVADANTAVDDEDIPPLVTAPDPEDPDTEIEYYPDLVREHCTYFEPSEDRLTSILKMLDYARLVDLTDSDVSVTELGRTVVADMRAAEQAEQATNAGGTKLTPTQAYLLGDQRDTTGDHDIQFTVLPLSVTHIVQAAVAEEPDFTTAIDASIKAPGSTVDLDTGDIRTDADLPIRRSLHRRPSYRQFLWLLHNDKNTFVLAYAGNSAEACRIVGMKSDLGDAATVEADPIRKKIKRARAIARGSAKFVAAALTGGPEGVWVGKPLKASDVHSDVVAFVAASRPGFTDAVAKGSSLAWEAYDAMQLNIGDFEQARASLNEGYGRGLVAQAMMPATPAIEPSEVVADVNADPKAQRSTVVGAEKIVERTANKVLRDMGLDVEVDPVMSSSGIPGDIMCQHTSTFRNPRDGSETIRRCNGHAIGGSGWCERHGGTYLDPEETENLVRASQTKIFAATSKATEVMIELMLHSSNDAIRLRAAEQLLNRGGLSESRDIKINVEHTVGPSPTERIRSRLHQLTDVPEDQQAAIEASKLEGRTDEYGDNIIDAEVEDIRVPAD